VFIVVTVTQLIGRRRRFPCVKITYHTRWAGILNAIGLAQSSSETSRYWKAVQG